MNESGHEEEIISLVNYFSSRQRQTDRQTDSKTDRQTDSRTDRLTGKDRQTAVRQTDSRTDRQTDIVILSNHPSHTLTSSMPLISRIAPRTRENTPVPKIHSLVRPPFRTEGALSAVIK